MTSEAKESRRTWLYRSAISIAIAFMVLLFVRDAFYQFDLFDRFRQSFIDRNFAYRGPLPIAKESLDVIIISISDKSETTVPDRFPFPRSYYARAVRNLNRAGAKAIGIDLTFEQTDVRGPQEDDELFQAIQKYRNVVVAGKTDLRIEEATVVRDDENFHSIFYPADSSVGIVYVPNDADGVYRRYLPFTKMPGQDRLIPSFALALMNKVYQLPSTQTASFGPSSFILGDNTIPAFDDVTFLINYYGPAGKTFRTFDIVNVLDDAEFQTLEEREFQTPINVFDDPDYGLLHDGVFKDKVVLIGPYFSESKDIFNVPISEPGFQNRNQMYGVELHANALQTLLHKNYIVRPPLWVDILYLLMISLFTFFVITWLKLIKSNYSFIWEILGVALVIGMIFGILQLSMYLFKTENILFPTVSPSAAVIFNYVGSAVYQYLTERKQKVMIKGMFSQYLNPSVVNELIQNPEKLQLGGEKKELTVFFSDIASFTSFSEKLSPEELVSLMNEYLSSMTDIIIMNDGTLDKYIGDAVMAFWGAPIPLENHAYNACISALQMQKKAEEIAVRWRSEGKPNLVVRMGLNTSEMVVGNLGGVKRFDYTVLGDAVNLASRMEGANKTYDTRIMISESTYAMVQDQFFCRELDLLVVKGKTKPIKVFELIGTNDATVDVAKRKTVEGYLKGLAQYRTKDFTGAIDTFTEVLRDDPNDHPSSLYVQRCEEFLKNPPPEEWNGVFEMKTK